MAETRAVVANGFPATLDMPDGRSEPPVVLMIAGSGPTDRDGNSRLGINANYLAKLAGALGDSGIASLRYDKRGVAGSIAPGREEDVTIATFVDDALAVLDWLEAEAALGPVFVLGHSEGGLVALGLAARRAELAGVVLVATPGRPPADTLRDQMQALDEPLRQQAMEIIAAIERGDAVSEVPAALMALFRPSVQPFLRSLFALRPAAELAAVARPALVVGGGTDLQVTRADFDALFGAAPAAEHRWFDRMNHVLVDSVSVRLLNQLTYVSPDLPLTGGLSETIADFVLRNSKP